MRHLLLYLRSRSAPATLAATLCCATGLAALGHAVHDALARRQLAVLATVLAAAAVAPGLAGADVELERVTALAWPPRRAAHLVVAGAVAIGLLAATALIGTPMTSIGQLARNSTGLTGLVGLGAATLGASRAFLLPLLWIAGAVGVQVAAASAQPSVSRYQLIAAWMMQPAGSRAALITALALGATGLLAYALAGSRP